MNITVDKIMAMGTCKKWTRERVEAVVGEGQSLHEFAGNNSVPEIDRIWVLAGLMDRKRCLLFRAAIAEARLFRERYEGREPDPRSWRAVRTLEAYARGEVDVETLREARDAAYAAYRATDYVDDAAYAIYAAAAAHASYAAASSHAAAWDGITWRWLLDTAVKHAEASNPRVGDALEAHVKHKLNS